MRKEVIIIGASGHGKVIADIVEKSGDTVFGFLDDDLSKKGVIGKIEKCTQYSDKLFIIAIGNNEIRKRIAIEYPNIRYYTAIHPTAVIANGVNIGKGTAVMANAVINSEASVGEHCIINTASVVEHECDLGSFVHVSPGTVLCGNVKIGESAHIGASAVVRNNISITANVTVGCGSCVVKDISEQGTYVGIPVKRI